MHGLLAAIAGQPAGATPAPVNTSPPTISGNAFPGGTLTAAPGTWDDADSFAYQWRDGAGDIVGATSSTYLVQLADRGESITVRVTATGPGGSTDADSSGTSIPTPIEEIPALTTWTAAGTPIRTGGQDDPFGGTAAVYFEDDDSGVIEGATRTTTASLTASSAYQLVWWVKKDAVTSRFPEFQHTRGGNVLHVHLNTETGATAIRVQSGFTSTSFVATEVVTGWWRCVLSFTAATTGTLAMPAYPAMGTSLGGSVSAALTGSITYIGDGLYAA